MYLLADILGYLAVAFAVASAVSKNQTPFRIYNLIATTLFGVSIFFYDGFAGASVAIYSSVMQILFFCSGEAAEKRYARFTPLFALAVYFLVDEGLRGLLPAVASLFSFNSLLLSSALPSRILMLASALVWLAYAIAVGSIPAIIYDIVAIPVFLFSIYRLSRSSTVTTSVKGR